LGAGMLNSKNDLGFAAINGLQPGVP
jgi:hypothetical protein